MAVCHERTIWLYDDKGEKRDKFSTKLEVKKIQKDFLENLKFYENFSTSNFSPVIQSTVKSRIK